MSKALKALWTEKRLQEHDSVSFALRRPGPTGHGYLGEEEIAETVDEDQLLVDAITDQTTADSEADTEPLPYDETMGAASEAART